MPLMDLPGHSVYPGSQLTSFFELIMFMKPDLHQSRVISMLPQLCTVGTVQEKHRSGNHSETVIMGSEVLQCDLSIGRSSLLAGIIVR